MTTLPKLKYRNGDNIETLLGLSGELLLSGSYYMHGDQSFTLAKSVYEFQTGLVFVWSFYNGQAQDYWYQCHLVPREDIRTHYGMGHVFVLAASLFECVATKYIYIDDQKITGHDNNTMTGTAASGIKYANNAFVLREVWGV